LQFLELTQFYAHLLTSHLDQSIVCPNFLSYIYTNKKG
jgi:hypothetical protein